MLLNYVQQPQIYKKHKCDRLELCDASLEAFAATKFNEIFSGRQQRQDVKVLPTFRELSPSSSPGDEETLHNFQTLTPLSAREDFIQICVPE
jgi:hypothetical protein